MAKLPPWNFFGEAIDVVFNELAARELGAAQASPPAQTRVTDAAFRKSFEAVNLGVVPNDPGSLGEPFTIGGEPLSTEIGAALANASKRGLCRVYMGYYGSGKSHHLALVKAIALRDGWVTASVELDPQSRRPCKTVHCLHQSLIEGLAFPMRADGSRSIDFFDLIKEIQDHWPNIRDLNYFKRSPWFSQGMAALTLSVASSRRRRIRRGGKLACWSSQTSKRHSLAELACEQDESPVAAPVEGYGSHIRVSTRCAASNREGAGVQGPGLDYR